MARIKGTGVPTRKTKGALGDIYTDTKTGRLYECVFAYRNGSDNMFDCQWKELTDKEEVKSEPQQAAKVEETKAEEVKPEVTPEPETEKIPVEESVETKPEAPARTNYAAYSKQNK